MAGLRLPICRSEETDLVDDGDNKSLFTITYDPELTGNQRMKLTDNTENQISAFPILIYDYLFELVTNYNGTMWQYYCDHTDRNIANIWDLNNGEFHQALKQHKLIFGSQAQQSGADGFHKHTLRFKARWNYRKKEWAVPPITLSGSKKNHIGFVTHCKSTGAVDRTFYGMVTIKRWKQLT
jgi:hypothetical protein